MIALADAAATARAGEVLATLVRGREGIALVGDLGAGKTTFVTAFVAALGGGVATSPTFSLVNEYRGGRFAVMHADLYRIEREAEVAELGLEDADGILIVEWADRFAVLPADHLRLELAHADRDGGRTLTVAGTGPQSQALATALASALRSNNPPL